MYFSRIFKVKEGKLDKLKEWFNILDSERREEAISTFSFEKVTREVFVLFKGNSGDYYVIGLNETEDGNEPGPSDPNVKINIEHKEVKRECLESISENGEILMDLKI